MNLIYVYKSNILKEIHLNNFIKVKSKRKKNNYFAVIIENDPSMAISGLKNMLQGTKHDLVIT